MTLMARKDGQVQLALTLSNSSPQPLSGFLIQVNKNPFGFGPAAAMQVPDIAPGSSAETALQMVPGQLLSNTPPTNPLFLQVAVKNSLDIFYFNVPFDLSAVLLESGALDRAKFTEIWQRVGEARQHAIVANLDRPMTVDTARSRLALDNVHYVAQRQVDESTTVIYTSALTSNNCTILAEFTLASGSTSMKIATRTETPVLVPMFEASISKRLGSR
jgi:AP-1 complex subunit beta-1